MLNKLKIQFQNIYKKVQYNKYVYVKKIKVMKIKKMITFSNINYRKINGLSHDLKFSFHRKIC